MQKTCEAIADHDLFQGVILMLIVLTALGMGAEATPPLATRYGDWLGWLFVVSQAIFVAEIVIRLGAHAPRFPAFFRDPWNSFDFAVVALSLLPTTGGFALAARVLRVLRVLRLFSVSDRMRDFFTGGRRGLGALVPAAVVLAVLAYVFALAGFHLFGEGQAGSWGTLALALDSVGRLATARDVAATAGLGAAGIAYLLLFYGAALGLAATAARAVLARGRGAAGS